MKLESNFETFLLLIDVIEAISIGFLPSDAEVGMESGSARIF